MPRWVKHEPPPMSSKLTISLLQELTPLDASGLDLVTSAARDLLLDCIRSQDHVQKVFFPEFEPPQGIKNVDFGCFPMPTLATCLMAQTICQEKDEFGFHSVIDRTAVEDKLREIYQSLQWKKLGFHLYTMLYPDVVKDAETGVRLRDFMTEDGHLWAEQMITRMNETTWTASMQQKLVKGQSTDSTYNSDMNGIFLKMHLLDPQSVIPAYQMLLNQRALPSVNLELATRNYLGGPLDNSQLTPLVAAAIMHESPPVHSKSSTPDSELVDVTFGAEVAEFITTHCQNEQLWTGTKPDNTRTMKAKDKCVVM